MDSIFIVVAFFIAVSLLSIPCMMYYKKKEKKEQTDEIPPEAVPWVPGSYITKAEEPIWRLIKQGQWMAVSGAGKGGNEKLVEKT